MNRFARHELNYIAFVGALYLMAASTKDVVLGWGLTVARFTTGFLHLFAYLWDQSMSSAFLSMALSDIITAMLAVKLLPCYTKAFPRRCSSQRLKAANLLFATISISLSVLHILGIVYIHRIYSVFSYTVGLGEFPRLQNTGCAPLQRVALIRAYLAMISCAIEGSSAQVGPLPGARGPGPRPAAPPRRLCRRRGPGAQARRRPPPAGRP